MKKCFFVFLITLLFVCFNFNKASFVLASPKTSLENMKLAEELLIKIQNSSTTQEKEELYNYFETFYNENTLFFSYKIKELEEILQDYRENILINAKKLAQEKEYKKAVELLQSKANLFKDKSTLNSLVSYYSKFFIQDGLFYYEYDPQILNFNKLIAYPNVANSDENFFNVNKSNLTSSEFSKLLTQLYQNNYILVNLSDFISIEDGKVSKKDLYLPPNKKPIVLVFSDVNYTGKDGFIEKFVIDPQNEIACYNSKEIEKNIISYNTDFIPILENFISINKDFSFNNARGIICVNENDKILGYNISKQNPNQTQDILTLKKLVCLLKEKGYTFAYSGDLSNKSSEEISVELNSLSQIFGNFNAYFCKNIKINSIKTSILEQFGFKILLDTIKTNTIIAKNNTLIIPYNTISINSNSLNYLDVASEEIYDHVNRKDTNF